MDASSNIIQTRMIDLTETSLSEVTKGLAEGLTEPGSSIIQRTAEAVVHETTSPLLVSVAGHSS